MINATHFCQLCTIIILTIKKENRKISNYLSRKTKTKRQDNDVSINSSSGTTNKIKRLLKELKKRIKKENQQIRETQSKKISQVVNFKIAGQKRIFFDDIDGIELIEQKQKLPKRDRLATI